MVTTPHNWGDGERLTSANSNYLNTAIAELQVADLATAGRITTLEAGTVQPYYCQTIFNVNQSGPDTGSAPYAYSGSWPPAGGFTTAPSGVAVPASGKYAITFLAQCSSGSFGNFNPTDRRTSHWLFTGYDTTKHARSQTTAVCLGMSSTSDQFNEDTASVTVLASLAAGDVVTPAWVVQDGYNGWLEPNPPWGFITHLANPVCTCRLTIVRISA